MTPQEIKAQIALAGTTQSAIARHLGMNVSFFGRVIAGTARSARAEAALERITGKPINTAPRKKGGRTKTVWTGQSRSASPSPVSQP